MRFEDVSHVIADNVKRMAGGMAMIDIDQDGEFEIFVTAVRQSNAVLKWNGKSLIDVTPLSLRDASGPSVAVAAADIDGDGIEEIFVVDSVDEKSEDRLFKFDTKEKRWSDILGLSKDVSAHSGSSRSVAVIDRDGDGKYGFLVTKYNGPLIMLEAEENSKGEIESISNVAGSSGIRTANIGGRSLIVAPLSSQSMTHSIFVGVENGPNLLFNENDDGIFNEIGMEANVADIHHNTRGVAILPCYQCELSSSSRGSSSKVPLGLVVGNLNGESKFYMPTSDRAIKMMNNASADISAIQNIRNVIVADFDNDGIDEIFFNVMGGSNVLVAFRGGRWVPVNAGKATETDGFGTGALATDIDGDGQLELVVSHGELQAQRLGVYRMAVNSNHFLRVLPLTQSGAPARGARVTVTQKSRTQTKVIDAGSGYLCQQEPIAHFGLGADSTVLKVTVEWSDGAIKELQANEVAVDTILRVHRPSNN
jgi:hypothetical protein